MKDRMNDAIPWLVRNPHSTWTTVGPAVTSALCLDATPRSSRRRSGSLRTSRWSRCTTRTREGAPARNFTAGFSAQAGVTAALTALAGLEGSRAAIEEVYDPSRSCCRTDSPASSRRSARSGRSRNTTSNRTRPAGTPTRRSIDAPARRSTGGRETAASDRATGRRSTRPTWEAITVRTFANATDMSHAEPETMTAGKFSAPYVLATYLCRGASTSTTSRPRRWPTRRFSPWPHASNSAKTTGTRRRSRVVVGSECRRRTARRDDSDRCARLPRGDYRDPIPDAEYRARNRAPWRTGSAGGGNITPESTRRSTPSTRSRSARSGRRSTRSDRNTEQTFCWTERTRQILHPAMRSVEYGTRRHTEHGIGRSDRTIVPYHRTAR